MPSLDEYLKSNPELSQGKKKLGDVVVLDVNITGSDEDSVDFVHLGAHFSATREDVVDVSDSGRQAMNVQGKPAIITLKPNARLEVKQYITASDLNASIPLGLALPSAGAPRLPERAGLAAWASRVGYPQAVLNIADVSTSSTCDSYSDGQADDSKFDDW